MADRHPVADRYSEADRQSQRDEPDPSPAELDQLNFDHHREERYRLLAAYRADHERSSSDDRDENDEVTLRGFVDSRPRTVDTRRTDARTAK